MASVGVPNPVSLAIDFAKLQTEVRAIDERVERLENRTETTGQHDVAELRRKVREFEREEEARVKEEREREEEARKKKEAEEAGAKKEAAAEASRQAEAKRERRQRYVELAVAALLGGAVSFGVTVLRDCQKPPAPVVVPVQMPANSAK